MESSVCICGAGTMGKGIAFAMAMKGITTLLYDLNPQVVSNASSGIEKALEAELEKKRISSSEKEETLKRIRYSSDLSQCRAPLILEAILEKTEMKSALFTALEKINGKETVYATNTSSLSVTRIAELTPFPERVIGMHFFNPANRMQLVEIVKTKYSSPELVKRFGEFAVQLGKTPVFCSDSPGFIVNHVARPYYLEALRLLQENISDISTIDKLLESAGFKMGPFHLMDLIGNDINYTVSLSLYEAMGKPGRLKPSALQENYVNLGLLGRKTGQGFFSYTKPAAE